MEEPSLHVVALKEECGILNKVSQPCMVQEQCGPCSSQILSTGLCLNFELTDLTSPAWNPQWKLLCSPASSSVKTLQRKVLHSLGIP